MSFQRVLIFFLILSCIYQSFAVDCDSNVSCDDNYTCCRNRSGDWACCPYRNAQCCPQLNICCRSGLHCSSTGCRSGTSLERFFGYVQEKKLV